MEPVRAKLHNIFPIMPSNNVAEHMETAHKARYSELRGSEILTDHLSTRYDGFSILLQKLFLLLVENGRVFKSVFGMHNASFYAIPPPKQLYRHCGNEKVNILTLWVIHSNSNNPTCFWYYN